MVEIWRPVKRWFNGTYMVSNLGHIRRTGKLKNMKPSVNSSGLLTVTLSFEGQRRNTTLAQLVAEAFVYNPEHYPNVMYLDGDPTNIAADNLMWVADNEVRWMRKATGQSYSEYRFPVEIIAWNTGESWLSITKCAESLGVSTWAVVQALDSGEQLKGRDLSKYDHRNFI